MKLSRRLIPAIAMLMVSAVLMSTASFAWFSMNTQVTANNIKVTATAPASLLISTNATSGFGSTVDLTPSPEIKIVPVGFNAKESLYKLKAETSVQSQVDGDGKLPQGIAYPNDAYFVSAVENQDYYFSRLYLKLDGTTDTQMVSVTVDIAFTSQAATEEAIQKAFKVVLIFKDQDTDQDTKVIFEGDATDLEKQLFEITGNAAATEVQVYVYLDGNDEDCKNANISEETSLTVNLEFSLPAAQ